MTATNDYFKSISDKRKEEVRNLLDSSNPVNIILKNIYDPLISYKGVVSGKKVIISIFDDVNSIEKVTGRTHSYMLQIEFEKEGKSLIIGANFRGDEDTDWKGDKIGLSKSEKILVNMLLNASEGKAPFFFTDQFTKDCAAANGFVKFFEAIN